MQPLNARGDRPLRRILHGGNKGRVDLPVRRVIAAELVAELLPQIFLRPRGARVVRLAIRLRCAGRARSAASSCAGVMNFCSRIAASTRWLRSSAPS